MSEQPKRRPVEPMPDPALVALYLLGNSMPTITRRMPRPGCRHCGHLGVKIIKPGHRACTGCGLPR